MTQRQAKRSEVVPEVPPPQVPREVAKGGRMVAASALVLGFVAVSVAMAWWQRDWALLLPAFVLSFVAFFLARDGGRRMEEGHRLKKSASQGPQKMEDICGDP